MTNREKYNIYNEMFNNCARLEDNIREALYKLGAKVYNIEIYVGKEETQEYMCYIEFNLYYYRNMRGLYTEKDLKTIFGIR